MSNNENITPIVERLKQLFDIHYRAEDVNVFMLKRKSQEELMKDVADAVLFSRRVLYAVASKNKDADVRPDVYVDDDVYGLCVAMFKPYFLNQEYWVTRTSHIAHEVARRERGYNEEYEETLDYLKQFIADFCI